MDNQNITYSTSPLTDEFGNSIITNDFKLGLIKICVVPACESVYHNCPYELKKCEFCGGSIKMINQDTFFKKFSNRFFQYNQPTGDYYRPKIIENQISFDFDC